MVTGRLMQTPLKRVNLAYAGVMIPDVLAPHEALAIHWEMKVLIVGGMCQIILVCVVERIRDVQTAVKRCVHT
jgi:hypothetical protein